MREIEIVFDESGPSASRSSRRFTLDDRMVEQRLSLKRTKFSELGIVARSVYPGSKWDDVCISELKMVNRQKPLSVAIEPSKYGTEEYQYDEGGNRIWSRYQYDHEYFASSYFFRDGVPQSRIDVHNDREADFACSLLTRYETGPDGRIASTIRSNGEMYRVETQQFRDGRIDSRETRQGGRVETTRYYYRGDRLVSDTYGDYVYEDGRLAGYVAYRHYTNAGMVSESAHTCKLEYGESGLPIRKTMGY
jgi:hypothetical protein